MHYLKAVLPRIGRPVLRHPIVLTRQFTIQIPPIPEISEEPVKEEKKLYKILTIDGGGIRGIIPATVLAEIEEIKGKPIAELFDYIAGTSTGGLLALGLNFPDKDNPQKPVYSANDLLKLYEEQGKSIFKHPLEEDRKKAFQAFFIGGLVSIFLLWGATSLFLKRVSENKDDENQEVVEVKKDQQREKDFVWVLIWEDGPAIMRVPRKEEINYEAAELGTIYGRVISGAGLLSAIILVSYIPLKIRQVIRNKYTHFELEKILRKYFGDTALKDSITEVLVTTYDVQNHSSKFLTRHAARKNSEDNFLMREAVRATSAAPAFFKPYIRDKNKYIDGGVYANNPAMCAVADAQRHAKGKELLVVSLGTGVYRPEEKGSFESYGFFQWMKKDRLLRAIMEGSSTAVNSQMKELLPEESYIRIQIQTSEDIGLDNVDPDNIERLKGYGKRCVEENREEIERVCRRLQ